MALVRCVRVLPVLLRRAGTPVLQQLQPARGLFDPWGRSSASDMRALVRDMDRQMDRLEREMLRALPSTSLLPRALLPTAYDNTLDPSEGEGQYRVAVDLSGFKPEEIDVALDESGRRLTINAKRERSGRDGSRFRQDVTRVITLPEAVNAQQLKSLLHPDGYLAIEAPFNEEHTKPRQIPVKNTGETTPQLEEQKA